MNGWLKSPNVHPEFPLKMLLLGIEPDIKTWDPAYTVRVTFGLCRGYVLVNMAIASENGHRNSEFSHQKGDFLYLLVCLITRGCMHLDYNGIMMIYNALSFLLGVCNPVSNDVIDYEEYKVLTLGNHGT